MKHSVEPQCHRTTEWSDIHWWQWPDRECTTAAVISADCQNSSHAHRPKGEILHWTVESGAVPAFRGPLVLCEHGGGGGGVGGVQLRHLTTNRQAISGTNKPVTALHHQDASLHNSLRIGLYSAAGPAGELTQLSAGSGEYYRT